MSLPCSEIGNLHSATDRGPDAGELSPHVSMEAMCPQIGGSPELPSNFERVGRNLRATSPADSNRHSPSIPIAGADTLDMDAQGEARLLSTSTQCSKKDPLSPLIRIDTATLRLVETCSRRGFGLKPRD